jgi:NAD(P)H-dependent FMN reductase
VAEPLRVLLIPGSLRARSTNVAVLRTAREVAPAGMATIFYDGLAGLPHFNPDDDLDPVPPAVATLRAHIRGADAVLLSTPEYAGALPGSFKNLLDWTIGDDQPGSIYEKPVGWINASSRGAVDAHESLRKVLGYAHATIVEAACTVIPITGSDVGGGGGGVIEDPARRRQIAETLVRLGEGVSASPSFP